MNYKPKPGEVFWLWEAELEKWLLCRLSLNGSAVASCIETRWLPDTVKPVPFEIERHCLRPLERPAPPLPTVQQLTGSDPDFTGDMSTQEYIDEIRGRHEPQEEVKE